MISQFKTLIKVKKLHEDKALRALEAERKALLKAKERTEQMKAQVKESARTLPARERAVYDKILQKVVDVSAVDEAKADVLHLMEDHQKLVDRKDRALEFVDVCQKKVTAASEKLRKCQAAVEKIQTVTNDMIERITAEETAREEAEIEELFAKPVTRPDIGEDAHDMEMSA